MLSRSVALLTLLALAPSIAVAIDGVVEINQTTALAGGITPGDTAGFPVTISKRGSYRLTSNLEASASSVRGFLVTSPDVTIDLNGFTLAGPIVCTGDPPTEDVSCPGMNAVHNGIDASAAAATGLTVRNGTIRGFPYNGLQCSKLCRIVGVTVEGNGGNGMLLGDDATVRESIARFNFFSGFTTFGGAGGAVIESSEAIQNGSAGFFVHSAIVRSCRAVRNQVIGISTGEGSLVSRNTVLGNGGHGIQLNGGSAFDNAIRENGASGIHVSTEHSGYARNAIDVNAATVTGGALAVELSPNQCGGDTTCP